MVSYQILYLVVATIFAVTTVWISERGREKKRFWENVPILGVASTLVFLFLGILGQGIAFLTTLSIGIIYLLVSVVGESIPNVLGGEETGAIDNVIGAVALIFLSLLFLIWPQLGAFMLLSIGAILWIYLVGSHTQEGAWS